MLFLAGLMGVVGVGAASFAVVQLQQPEEEDDIPENDTSLEDGDLLDEVLPTGASVQIGGDGADVLVGSERADDIDGGDGSDQIGGYGGDDSLTGGAGNDVLAGGEGEDYLYGGAGADVLHGDDENDQLFAEIGHDTVFGHTGNDLLDGGEGDDSLVGGTGADTLSGGSGNDALIGGLGNDLLSGDAGSDVLMGGAGQDVLNGLVRDPFGGGVMSLDDADYLNGGADDDTIIAGDNDTINSGEGADQILVGDWISEGQTAEVVDYESGKDSLMLVWDDMDDGASEPTVTVEPDPHDDEVMHVLMNGRSVAEIYGDPELKASDVTIIPLSSALIVGLQAA